MIKAPLEILEGYRNYEMILLVQNCYIFTVISRRSKRRKFEPAFKYLQPKSGVNDELNQCLVYHQQGYKNEIKRRVTSTSHGFIGIFKIRDTMNILLRYYKRIKDLGHSRHSLHSKRGDPE